MIETEPLRLTKSARVVLDPADPLGPFTITQADITFNGADHINGRHELNLVLVLERDIPKQGDPG